MLNYPDILKAVIDKLIDAGIRPVIVGGYVRDYFVHRESKDIDIELYGIASLQSVEKILEEFATLNSVGKSFGVCKLQLDDLEIDFSLPREDSKQSSGHRGFVIKVDSSLDFTSAASRRDFTINAMGYDLVNKKILDPFGGREDLNSRVLRAVDLQKFGEDPLRILRAVSFVGRFELTAEKNLHQLLQKMIRHQALQELPKERIFEEIKKLLLKSQKPSLGLYFLESIDGFLFFDEFQTINKNDRKLLFDAVDRAVKLLSDQTDKQKLTVMLAILISKFSPKDQNSFLDKLTNSKDLKEAITKLTQIQFQLSCMSDYSIYKLATEIETALFIPYYLALSPKERNAIKELEKRSKELGVFHKALKPLIQGRDLIDHGMKPSKEFAYILDDLYEKQMRGEFKSKEEGLATYFHLKDPSCS